MNADRQRRKPPRLGLVATALAGASLLAGGAALAGDPILHEFFVIPTGDRDNPPGATSDESDEDTTLVEELSASLSDQVELRESTFAPPPLTIENRGEELEVKADGRSVTPEGALASSHNGPPTSNDLARPDRETTLDGSLRYYTVFNPSVVPWKRISARDSVHADYSLDVRNSSRRVVPVKDRPVRGGFERFWGSVLIRMEKDRSVGLPTVAPDVNVLRVQTEPPTRVTIERDAADNYFITSPTTGAVRVNYLLEAPSTYFGGELDPTIEVRELPQQERPKLPASVLHAARTAIDAIGVDRDAPFAEQLALLVEYFRSFEAREFPDDQRSENVYLDLTLTKLGVCRHRAFAFVVTAHALGILARYVHNEAHAFVEVKVPRRGWLRIDLGGAAVDFDVQNGSGKVLHTPDRPDRLPQPTNFTSSYSYRAGTGQPEADVDGDGKGGEPLEGVPPPDGRALRAADDPQGNGWIADPTAGSGADGEARPTGDETGADDDLRFPAPTAGDAPPAPAAQRQTTKLTLRRATSEVYRGENLKVAGELLTGQDLPLSAKNIEAFLLPKGDRSPESFVSVGTGRTDAKGLVTLEITIPETLPLGRWSLYLYFRGDATLEPSHSR